MRRCVIQSQVNGGQPGQHGSCSGYSHFGISESRLTRWLQIADRDDATTSGSAQPREGNLETETAEGRTEAEIIRLPKRLLARDIWSHPPPTQDKPDNSSPS